MDISIRSRNVEVPEDVRSVVKEKVGHLSRYLDGVERAEVNFTEERNPRIADKEVCEVRVVGRGTVLRARASAADTLVAVDRVLDKLEHRMEKLKGRLVGRSHPRHHASPKVAAAGGAAPVRRPGSRPASARRGGVSPGTGEEELDEAGGAGAVDGAGRIVKVKQFAIKPMTPEEAVLEMDLLAHDFFFFTNAETDRPAVVYRRNDGDIGLIDSI